MCVETKTPTASESSTGSASLDRILSYDTVKKTTGMAEDIVANSPVLSDYVAPVAKKSVAVSVAVAGKVPGVKTMAGKVDEFSDRTLEKMEGVLSASQEKLTQYVKETLPLDRDSSEDATDEGVLSVSGVKERVIINGHKAVKKVVPETMATVAGKSASVIATCYNGMTKENIKGAYQSCTLENAKTITKDTVTGAYKECTYENAEKVVKATASVTKAAVDGSIATTKKMVDSTVATTKAGYETAKNVTKTTVKVAGQAKEYALGASPVDVADAPPAEPETPSVKSDSN